MLIVSKEGALEIEAIRGMKLYKIALARPRLNRAVGVPVTEDKPKGTGGSSIPFSAAPLALTQNSHHVLSIVPSFRARCI